MSGRRILVTGSSRGIGKAIAERLASQGDSIALHYTANEGAAFEARQKLGEKCCGLYRADLADPEQAERLFESAVKDGPLDALVNNAGTYSPLSFLDSDASTFTEVYGRTMRVNFESPLRLMRAAGLYFRLQGGGKILNVASRVGFRGEANASFYSASKAALINATHALAVELAPFNIHVFGIAPGWVETAMAREGMERRLEQILRDIPLGRMATPEDCAAAAGFLLSPEAAYLSGVVIDINGASYFH